MAVTNVAFKTTEADHRAVTGRKDYPTQPRILQPVAAIGDLTAANGFTAANLRPGDMIYVVAGATTDELVIRNGANDGWEKVALTAV